MAYSTIGIDASRAVIEQRTGTEVYSLHLIRALLEMETHWRFRLYFNVAPRPGLFPIVNHCQHRIMPLPRLWTHLCLSAEMLVHPPDVLFVPSHVLPLIHPKKSVVTVHDLGYHHYPGAHTPGQRRYLAASTRYHVKTAAQIIADSRATRDDLVRIYGADPARITVVHLGVAPDLRPLRDAGKIAAVKAKYGIDRDYILYIGTLHPRKNLVRLIEAFGKSASDSPGKQLVLGGKKGWLYHDIWERVRTLGLQKRVILTGFIDDVDLAALYSGATAFVMPSLYEGFCIPVLEAMACQTPVMCSNTSSLPEVVGDAAYTFDPLDTAAIAAALTRLGSDDALRSTLIARGIRRVKRFTWENCARQTLAVLQGCSILQSSG